MLLFPAMDIYEKKIVRLRHGDYQEMTVYAEDPLAMARQIAEAGAAWLHMVDLEGARDGAMPNFPVIEEISQKTGLSIEVGGGIRSLESIARYLAAGVRRVILGTKAVTDRAFLLEALRRFPGQIAVSADAKDGRLAIKGWTETSDVEISAFLEELLSIGVETVVVTDISRDGAMRGANLALYERLTKLQGLQIIASGGVSSYEDLRALQSLGLYGAILGKAMYEGAVDLQKALALLEPPA